MATGVASPNKGAIIIVAMSTHKEFWFEGKDGTRLLGQAWLPDRPAKAVLTIVHGVGEYIGPERFGNVIERAVPQGYAVYGADLRGHGQSKGRRGHITSWNDYHTDLSALLGHVRAAQPGLPVFLWGFSLGALIVAEYIEREPGELRGAILMGTPNQPSEAAPPWMAALARVLSGLWPTFRMDLGLKPEQGSRDLAVIEQELYDPKLRHVVTARWGAECLNTVDYINAHAGQIRLPVLVLHGGSDRLNAVEGARRFFNDIRSADKTLIVYPEGYHRLHYDLDADRVIGDMLSWMDSRAAA